MSDENAFAILNPAFSVYVVEHDAGMNRSKGNPKT